MRLGKLLIVAAVLGTLNLAAKEPALTLPIDPQGKITYQEDVPIKGVNAPELYARARAWVVQTYLSSDDEIRLDDKAGGRITVLGHFVLPILAKSVTLQHALTIEPKDGQYRVTLTGLVLDFDQGGAIQLETYVNLGGMPKKGTADMLREADKACRGAMASLAAAMRKPLPAEKKKRGK